MSTSLFHQGRALPNIIGLAQAERAKCIVDEFHRMSTGPPSNIVSGDKLSFSSPHSGYPANQYISTVQPLPEPQFSLGDLETPSQMIQTYHGGMQVMNTAKPFSLPSLASITANLTPNETSMIGPHRSTHHASLANPGRRFSPLRINTDSNDATSEETFEDGRVTPMINLSGDRKPSINIANANRPRSRSVRSVQSFLGSSVDSGTPNDESGSDSGRSDKKKEAEDLETIGSAKKRSRTLTTPTQQRRLMQILEQTRFPSTDLREQLARELAMTPRRVQIWFQNRRQGMKKTQDQRTDPEPTPTPTNTYNRARGYSFGTYPVPSDASPHPQSQPQNSVYPSGLPAYTPTAPASSNPVFDSLPNHLYTSRPFARDGMPRQLPQLQLRNNASNSSLSTLNESACSDFAWSEPSAASSTWNGSTAGYPIISAPSFADRERLFPFGKQLSHPYESAHSQEFSIHNQPAGRQDHPASRSRSQTNPDFFQLDMANNMHHPLSQSELSHQSSSQLSQDSFRKADEYATPTQRLMSLETDCIPDRPDSVADTSAYDSFNLHDQVETASSSGEWNDALSRLKVADYPDSRSPKHSMDRMLSFHGGLEHSIYPLNYSTPDYTNDPMMGRHCADIPNELSTSDYVGVGGNSHLHLTEPQMINGPEDLDKCIQSSSPGHYRQRSRSFNG